MTKTLTNNFDRISSIYDALSCLVYFNAQRRAQLDQLQHILPGSRILIVGGGTGWILESISKRFESGLEIFYVEISEKMLVISKKRNCKNNTIHFVNSAIEDYVSDEKFDVIMTAYLFDNFTESQAKNVFIILNLLLKSKGKWLITEFVLDEKYGKWWKEILLKSMLLFFKSFGMVEGKALNDMLPTFTKNHYSVEKKLFYFGNFIKGTVYKKI